MEGRRHSLCRPGMLRWSVFVREHDGDNRLALIAGPGQGLEGHERGHVPAVVVPDVDGEANLRAITSPSGQQPKNVPQAPCLVLAGDAGRHADAAPPDGAGQGNRPADARLAGRRGNVEQHAVADVLRGNIGESDQRCRTWSFVPLNG